MKFVSIKTKFLSYFGFYFAFLYAILVFVVGFLGEKYYESNARRNARYFAKSAFKQVSEAYFTYFGSNPLRFSEKINELLFTGPDLERIVILDSAGNVVFSSAQLSGLSTDNEDIEELAVWIRGNFESIERSNRYYDIFIPVLNDLGRHLISVVFRFSKASIIRFQRVLFIVSLIAFFILTLGTLLIENLITRSFIVNIEKLKKAAESFEKGDYSVRAEVDSRDELQFLSEKVNSMLESITNYIYNLRAMVSELRARDKARDEILAKISHELRTPLTASRGYVDLLKSGKMGQISEEQKKALDIIERNLVRLENETRRLLLSSKVTLEHVEITKMRLDLESLVVKAMENFQTELKKKKQKIEMDLTEKEVYGDEDQLTSILENLLHNAIKYAPESGMIKIRSSSEGRNDRKFTKVEIYNSGSRIPDAEKQKIFDPFYQIEEGTKRESSGIGLGLYIVKRAVELHGGFVEVENVDNGVLFSVLIPKEAETDEENPGS